MKHDWKTHTFDPDGQCVAAHQPCDLDREQYGRIRYWAGQRARRARVEAVSQVWADLRAAAELLTDLRVRK